MIAPVVVFRLKPDGRAGATEKVIGDVPPVAVTGVKGVADEPALIV